MKIHIMRLMVLLGLLMSLNAQAESFIESPQMPNMLMYIQPLEYTSPIQLWHPYQGYWFYQGPVVEAQAMLKLKQVYGGVSLCDGNQSGKVLVWLQPRMFYNPQVQMFYSKVTANIYTGVGKFMASYEGESKVHGFINIAVDNWITQAYELAIDDMVAKMQADLALQTLVAATASTDNAADSASCSMVTLFPVPKIRVMSF